MQDQTDTPAAFGQHLIDATREAARPERLAPGELVILIRDSLLTRKGEVIDEELATERAKNLACWLMVAEVLP